MLTKLDIAAIRQADDLCVHLSREKPQGLLRLIKRKRPSDKDPFAQDIEHTLSETVELHGYRGREEIASGEAKCFAMMGHGPGSPGQGPR